jgi:hypothetical protein
MTSEKSLKTVIHVSITRNLRMKTLKVTMRSLTKTEKAIRAMRERTKRKRAVWPRFSKHHSVCFGGSLSLS